MLWGLEAGPMSDPELLARLNEVVAKSRARPPEILEIGTPKAHFPNAFASPHPARPRVLLSRTLLRHLDREEVAAIFAHEVAHLEHYAGKRARLASWSMFLFVILGAVIAAACINADRLYGAAFAELVWVVAISIGYNRRRRKQQVHEGHSDVRAAELCGDPEALIRALTKLHALGRVPDRWDREKSYSHPSLVRRIQAIRNAAVTSNTSHTSRDSVDSGLAHTSVS
jgi:heat shock protein HtpX